MQRVFVRFLEEIENTKKTFRNYLTFSSCQRKIIPKTVIPLDLDYSQLTFRSLAESEENTPMNEVNLTIRL